MGIVASTTSPSTPAQKSAQVPMSVYKLTEAATSAGAPERTLPPPENQGPGREIASKPPDLATAAVAVATNNDDLVSNKELLMWERAEGETQVLSTSEGEHSGLDEHPVGSARLDEDAVAAQIIKLWAAERKVHGTTLRSLRERLSEQLSCFKTAPGALGGGTHFSGRL